MSIGKQSYQLPEFIPSNSNSGLHSCISVLQWTCYLNCKTYPLAPDCRWHQYTSAVCAGYWIQATFFYKW